MSSELQEQISPKALYLSVKRHFEFFFPVEHENSEDKNDVGSVNKTEDEDILITNDVDTDKEIEGENNEENFYVVDKTTCSEEGKSFNFSLDLYQWRKIQPISKCSVRMRANNPVKQKKWILPKYEWAGLLREKIWENTKSRCSWCFQTYYVKYNERVTILGACKECNAKIKTVITYPTENIASCTSLITDFDKNVKHNLRKKIKLSPIKRKELMEKMKHEAPITVHKQLISYAMEVGDPQPPHLPSHGTLRHIKHESNLSEYYHKDPILSLLYMAQNVKPYNDYFKHIAIHPHFYIYYWSTSQEIYYNQYHKNHRVILSIDATGSIFKETNLIVKNYSLLYVAVMYSEENKRSVPVAQMISSSQTMDTISNWLKSWKGQKSIPNEVILDQSSALIGATIKAFTEHKSTNDYLVESFRKLDADENSPDTLYVRIDTSHFVKTIYNFNCFRNVDQRTKAFYCKSILYLKNLDDYGAAKQTILDIITVALNKYDSIGSPCDEAKTRLKIFGKIMNLPDYKDLEHYSLPEQHILKEIKDVKEEHSFPKWYQDKLDRENLLVTLTDDDSDSLSHENLLYMPTFIPTLTRLVQQLPLWSNVMIPIYNSENRTASSSNVESYFKTLKRYLCRIGVKSNRLRLDQFIGKHADFIDGELKEAIGKVETTEKGDLKKRENTKAKVNKTEDDFPTESIFSETPSFSENWKGKGDARKVTKKKRVQMHKPVPLLLNGTRLRTGIKDLHVSNTCAFDSVAQVIAVGCVEGFYLNTHVLKHQHEFCQFIKKMIDVKITRTDIYKYRAQLLQSYFKKTVINQKVLISCECNVAYIFDNILIDAIYSASVKESCTNTECVTNKVQRKIAFLPLNFNMPNISMLNQSAECMLCEDNNIVQCRRNDCNGIRTLKYELSYTIAFELNQTDVIFLKDIPMEITLNNIKYEVLGLIEFLPSGGDVTDIHNIGHYRAHCRRNAEWKCFDDLNNFLTKTPNSFIANCILYGRK